jgi:hypothetical protein
MQIIAAIEYDRLRKEPENWNKVILHREGKFYRAYEWSAWLIKTVVCTDAFHRVGYFDRDIKQFFLR